MAKKNKSGKTWKQHASPYLRKALLHASRTWKPKKDRANMTKVHRLRAQRARINDQIRAELEKG